ncbi:MAG: hypothetical protein M3Q69_00550 [Acidobacteriota bacterium]|nr:hypothetical protein [Acidobacteriota bacterium]
MRRVLYLLAIFAIAGAVFGQGCPTPAIDGSVNPVCPYRWRTVSIQAPATGVWESVSWSIEGGSFQTPYYPYTSTWSGDPTVSFSSDNSGPVTLHLSARHSSGCTSQEVTTTIPLRVPEPPVINASAAELCLFQSATATADAPAEGAWQGYSWTIDGGWFQLNEYPWNGRYASTPEVRFNADGSGPVVLHLRAYDSEGCQAAEATKTISFRTVEQPVVEFSAPNYCPWETVTATVAPRAEGEWNSYYWSVEHGRFRLNESPWDSTSAYTPSVSVSGDGTGPVVLHFSARDINGCENSTTVELPLRESASPTITLGPGACPTSATVVNSSEYVSYYWQSSNASITSGWWGPEVTFVPNGNGPVELWVEVYTQAGCKSTGRVSFQASGLPSPQITFETPGPYCSGQLVTASVPDGGPGATYAWFIDNYNGSIWGSSTERVVKMSSTTGSLHFHVVVTNAAGCSSTSYAAAMINDPPFGGFRSVPSSMCANSTAVITGTPQHFMTTFTWAVTNGEIVSGQGTQSITVRSGNVSPMTVRVTYTPPSGCSTTSEQTIPVRIPPQPQITASGPTAFCTPGSVTLTASAGNSYLWSNGATSQSIVVTSSGNYSVQVTSADGCSATSAPVTVTATAPPQAPVITASGPTTFCDGGSVTLSAPSGYSYLWSNGATTQSIEATQSGAYSVIVTNGGGCSATSAPASVTVHSAIGIAWINIPNVCYGVETTAQTQAFSGGKYIDNVTYSWSISGGTITHADGKTVSFISEDPSVTLTVTATDTNGCTATRSRTEAVGPHVIAGIVANGPTTFCEGGQVQLTATGGSGTYYSWSDGQQGQAIFVSTPGEYRVTVDAGNGCNVTSNPVVVTVNPLPPVPTIAASGPTTFCAGESVTLTAPSGYTYSWSNGATTQSIQVTQSGNYSVTVSNASGCTATSSAVPVTVHSAIGLTGISIPPVCPGVETTARAQAYRSGQYINDVTYTWTISGGTITHAEGNTASFISESSAVTLSVTAIDANGCSAAATKTSTVSERLNPRILTSGPTTFCEGGYVQLTSSEEYGYQRWSNGSEARGITVLGPGEYTLTVWNSEGCSYTSEPVIVTVNPRPTTPEITIGGATSFCAGGSVTLTAPSADSYSWSNGATTQSIVVTQSGDYSVTVSNGSGCTATSSAVHVSVYDLPATPVITASGPTTFCAGGNVTLTAPTGYAYSWSNGATTQSITVNASGNYSVTVASASGCSAQSAATTVTVNDPPQTPLITADGSTTFCSGGKVTLTAPTGYSYVWSNGATTQSITVNASGNYSVTVSNANGCSAQSAATTVTVNDLPQTPVITANGSTTFCAGGNVTLTAPTGYSYSWSNGATTQSITVNTTGNYNVTVSNANGCSAQSAATTVTVNDLPQTPVITADGPTTFCAGGKVTLTAPAGYSYSWSNSATTQSITVNASGNYSVTVANASGCTAKSAAATVTVNDLPQTPVITANGPTTFCAGGNVTLTAPAGYAYSWSNGATTQSITVNTSGNYSVTVANASSCTAKSAATTVTVNDVPPTPVVTTSGATTFCAGGNVKLTAPAGYSYVWSNGATTQSITATTTGNYFVTVSNGNCSARSADVAVTVNPAPPTPVVTANGPLSFCAGGNVTLTAPAGYTYLWSNGTTTQSITVNATNTYSVTVSNGTCSTRSADVAVTVNPNPPTPVVTANGPLTFCSGGSVTLSAPAGYSYSWSNGATTQSIIVNASGNYSVTVRNASGCSATSSSTTVNVQPATTITQQPRSVTIARNSSTTLSVTATGTGLTYQWFTGTSGNTANPIPGATTASYTTPRLSKGTYNYWVRVTGSCGAVASNTATVTAQ